MLPGGGRRLQFKWGTIIIGMSNEVEATELNGIGKHTWEQHTLAPTLRRPRRHRPARGTAGMRRVLRGAGRGAPPKSTP
jgi:hypothetical protein